MPSLNQKPTLSDFQQYVRELEEERGFTDLNIVQECLMLGEEVGELFKAVRKSENITIDNNSKFGSVEEELADVLIFMCSIAIRCGIDLEKAFREKEELNKNRVWSKSN